MNNEDTKALQDRFHAARERARQARETEEQIYKTLLHLIECGHSVNAVMDGLHRNMQTLNEAMYPPKMMAGENMLVGRLG